MNRIKDLDHLLVESLRAAKMRQGCTNHTYFAEILRKQILELFPQPLDDKALGKAIRDILAKTHVGFAKEIKDRDVDQILALLQPKIEQERERIIKWGNEPCTDHWFPPPHKRQCKKCWQALKGGE